VDETQHYQAGEVARMMKVQVVSLAVTAKKTT
jgi:hypothetical protein